MWWQDDVIWCCAWKPTVASSTKVIFIYMCIFSLFLWHYIFNILYRVHLNRRYSFSQSCDLWGVLVNFFYFSGAEYVTGFKFLSTHISDYLLNSSILIKKGVTASSLSEESASVSPDISTWYTQHLLRLWKQGPAVGGGKQQEVLPTEGKRHHQGCHRLSTPFTLGSCHWSLRSHSSRVRASFFPVALTLLNS